MHWYVCPAVLLATVALVGSTGLLPHRIAYRIDSVCRDANGAIREIASSQATPNAWPPRAVLTLIAGSIPNTRSRPSGVAPIATDTEWSR